MVKYLINDKKAKYEVKVILVDKETKKLSSKLKENFTKDELDLFQNILNKSDKKEVVTVPLNFSEVILFMFDYGSKDYDLQNIGAKLVKHITNYKTAEIYFDDYKYNIDYFVLGLELGSYKFTKYFTKNVDEKISKLEKINLISLNDNFKSKDLNKAISLSSSVNFVRDMVNEPANVLTPESFAKIALSLKKTGVEVDILDEKKLQKLNFNLLLAVARGSIQKPRVVVLSWKGNTKKKDYDITLVGKGVTFDSGGLSIKTGGSMEGMNSDMAGAAAVAGTIKAASELKLKKNILGVVGLVENMPSGDSYKVNDIITSMSGQTVEVLNTDAEGRLVLADLLTYAQRKYKSSMIIDLATLTGAVSMLFGPVYAGIFSNDDEMISELMTSGKTTGDKLWPLPIDEYYNKLMDSDFADMQNMGKSRVGGGSKGACFLKRFIEGDTKWSHLDIAGVATESPEDNLYAKGATGFGVKLLIDYIENMK